MTGQTNESEKNKRKHTRLSLELRAELKVNDSSFEGSTSNMSFGGAFITFPTPVEDSIPKGTDCELQLHLGAGSKSLKVPIQCKIARCSEDGVGIEFCSTTIEGYWHFKNLMVYNSPEAEILLAELEVHPGLIIQKDNQ